MVERIFDIRGFLPDLAPTTFWSSASSYRWRQRQHHRNRRQIGRLTNIPNHRCIALVLTGEVGSWRPHHVAFPGEPHAPTHQARHHSPSVRHPSAYLSSPLWCHHYRHHLLPSCIILVPIPPAIIWVPYVHIHTHVNAHKKTQFVFRHTHTHTRNTHTYILPI